jgi:hypothetical protein
VAAREKNSAMIDFTRRSAGLVEIGAGLSDQRTTAGRAGVGIRLRGDDGVAIPAEQVHRKRLHRSGSVMGTPEVGKPGPTCVEL